MCRIHNVKRYIGPVQRDHSSKPQLIRPQVTFYSTQVASQLFKEKKRSEFKQIQEKMILKIKLPNSSNKVYAAESSKNEEIIFPCTLR